MTTAGIRQFCIRRPLVERGLQTATMGIPTEPPTTNNECQLWGGWRPDSLSEVRTWPPL